MKLRDYLLRDDLPGRRACVPALHWRDNTAPATVADVLSECPRGDWLLWLAERAGVPRDVQAAAVRPAVMRAARVYAANACDAAGLTEHAAALRALADDAPFSDVEAVALAVSGAAAVTAAQAAWVWMWAGTAAAAARAAWSADAAEAAEHALCADEVRAAIPDLAERVERAMESA